MAKYVVAQGVPFEETAKHKELGRDCHRRGHNGHSSIHCKSGKTIGGAVLLPYPVKMIASAVGSKRKRTEGKNKNDDKQPDASSDEAAAVVASALRPPIWALSDELSDL